MAGFIARMPDWFFLKVRTCVLLIVELICAYGMLGTGSRGLFPTAGRNAASSVAVRFRLFD